LTGESVSLNAPQLLAVQPWTRRVGAYLEVGQWGALMLLIVALPLSESMKNVAFGLALGCWVLQAVVGEARRPRLTGVGAAQALLVAVAFASALVAINRWQGFRGVWDLARAWLTFLLVLNTVTSWEKLKRCWALFVGATVIGCVVGMWEFVVGIPQALEARTFGGSHALEVLSLGHPNHTATYLLMMIVLALSYLTFAGAIKERRHTWLFAVGAAALIPSMFLTFSRSASLAFLVILIVMGIVARRRLLATALVALILVGAVGVTRIPSVSRHFSGATHPFSTGAITDRTHVWGGVLRLVSDRPAFGVGPRNFNYFDKELYGISPSMKYFNHAHSLYFNVLAEMGWLGAAALFLWLGTIALVGWRSRQALTTPWGRVVWMGALGSFLTITVSGIMTTTLHTEGAMAFSAIIGLLLAAREFPLGDEPLAGGSGIESSRLR
jgi:hypothetical protein